MYIYLYMHFYLYMFIHTYTHTCVCVCVYIYIYIYIYYVCMYMYMYIYVLCLFISCNSCTLEKKARWVHMQDWNCGRGEPCSILFSFFPLNKTAFEGWSIMLCANWNCERDLPQLWQRWARGLVSSTAV